MKTDWIRAMMNDRIQLQMEGKEVEEEGSQRTSETSRVQCGRMANLQNIYEHKHGNGKDQTKRRTELVVSSAGIMAYRSN